MLLRAALGPQLNSNGPAKTIAPFASAGIANPRIANCSDETNV